MLEHVCFVCPYDLGTPGGVQGQVVALAAEQVRRGRRASIVSPGATIPSLSALGIEHIGAGPVRAIKANGSVAPIGLSWPRASRAAAEVAAASPDVVHLHEPLTPLVGWPLLRQEPAPLVGTFHRSGVDRLYELAAPVLRRLASHLDQSAAVSLAAAETARRAVSVRCEVLFNGIDVEAHETASAWPTTGPTVLFLGRDEPRKGRQVLLDAASQLPSTVTVWATGQAVPLERGGAHVQFLGTISEDEKLRRLAAADVLCAPSLGGESFGMILIEALASSCAVVASDIDGYRQALDGTGVLVEPGDPAALARSLAEVLDGARRVDRAAGLSRARAFSIASLADAYEPLYDEARSMSDDRRRR